MILHALADYYDRLAEDKESGVAPMGFSTEKISFCLVIEPSGALVNVSDLRSGDGGKKRPELMIVPDRGGRAGKLLKPYFLWDNTGYVLGCDSKGKGARSREAFEAFVEFHEKMAEIIDDDGLGAVCKFLKKWDPADAAKKIGAFKPWDDVQDTNLVFQLRNARHYVHQSAAIKKGWLKFLADDAEITRGLCLVTGEEAALARLHPAIQGVSGAQSVGAAIVSFNLDAFTSYGKEQSFNAPVSADIAFKYTTALNYLLANRNRRVQLADATVVWWAQKPVELEDAFGNTLGSYIDAEDQATKDRVRDFLVKLKAGIKAENIKDANVPFYILGLSPNAARLSVRIWLQSTVGELATKLTEHIQDFMLDGQRENGPQLTVWRIVQATGRAEVGSRGYDSKTISPLLGGALTHAILTGLPYPRLLVQSILNRLRSDGVFTFERIATLKAYLTRQHRLLGTGEPTSALLDINRTDCAYVSGRLFAILDRMQIDSSGGSLNVTIKDKYFAAACASPRTVFPTVLRLCQHYLRKIRTQDERHAIRYQQLLDLVTSKLGAWPSHFNLESQAVFAIAFYQQTRDFSSSAYTYGAS